MRARGLVVVLLAGCGRVGFELDTDASIGSIAHDEDSDGVDDSVDKCPNLPGDQADRDGDGVGDACDPEPDNPRQRIALFATMRPGDAPFVEDVPVVMGPDGWTYNGDRIQLNHTGPIGDTDLWLGIDLQSIGPRPRQISVEPTDSDAAAHYFAELYDNTQPPYVGVSHFNAPGYTTLTAVDLLTPIHTGRMTLHLATRQSARQVTAEFGWIGEPLYAPQAPAPQLVPVNRFDLYVENLGFELDYLLVITSS